MPMTPQALAAFDRAISVTENPGRYTHAERATAAREMRSLKAAMRADFESLDFSGPENDAIIAALRLLQVALEEKTVAPDDGNIGEILTNSGEHDGLTVAGIERLLYDKFGCGDGMLANAADAEEA